MPRRARLDAPGVIHHVMIRGIERRSIFRDNKDRDDMIDRLGDLIPATKTACSAWALLHARQTRTAGGGDLWAWQRGSVLPGKATDPSGSTESVLLPGGKGVGGGRDSGCEQITDGPTGCCLCGKERGRGL
jgi:hypothetical protein